ncbi:nucleoside diphosphate kinase [Inquilinus ginsengisoli]|uniref:nucleoside-diphosphate kinase n=1 Tax=Inquilinus ginsengisoli TaxID=363840 RepID=UPI003D23F2CE
MTAPDVFAAGRPWLASCIQTPDALASGLCRMLDRHIAEQTGLALQAAVIRVHDTTSVRAFYGASGGTAGAHWPLVEALYAGRPVRITWWAGDQALTRLQRIKGRTQPAESAFETIRGRFWCDNPVANLIHVSDHEESMAREGRILATLPAGRPPAGTALRRPWSWTRHSALPTLVRLLAPDCGLDPQRLLVLPRSGDAVETARRASRALGRLAAATPAAGRLIEGYFAGNAGPLEEFIGGRGVGRWEALILRAGLHAAAAWQNRLAPEGSADKEHVA